VPWPSEEIRLATREENWGMWAPREGMKGLQISSWGRNIVLLKMIDEDDGHYCVMNEEGLDKKIKSTSIVPISSKSSGERTTTLFRDTQTMQSPPESVDSMNHPYGTYCGEKTVNFLVSEYTARVAVRFDPDLFHFKVNGDMHVALCNKNPYLMTDGEAPITPAKKCLKQETEGAWFGVTLKFEFDPAVRDLLTLVVSGEGLIGKVGGFLEIPLRQTACASVYDKEGGDLIPTFLGTTVVRDEL